MGGFFAKFAVINAVVDAGLIPIAIIAVLMSVVGAFYYLRIIKVMYFDAPPAGQHAAIVAPKEMQWALSVNALAVLILGFFPGALLALCARTFM